MKAHIARNQNAGVPLALGWNLSAGDRGKLDGTPEVADFANTLEDVVIKTVESGKMTKDLSLLIGPEQPWLTTEEFLGAIDENLRDRLSSDDCLKAKPLSGRETGNVHPQLR